MNYFLILFNLSIKNKKMNKLIKLTLIKLNALYLSNFKFKVQSQIKKFK